tara:strand:- start:2288 stop:4249 length:1962 start_codon:yes stop_codon:yes gene_type:complete
MSWCTTINDAGFARIAKKFQMKEKRMNSWGPCPVCKESRRSSGDSRGPIGITPNHRGWQCFRCDEKGDVADLLSYSLTDRRVRDTGRIGLLTISKWLIENDFNDKNYTPHPKDSTKSLYRSSNIAVRSPVNEKFSDFKWSPELPQKFHDQLFTPAGSPVLQYLLTQRKLNLEVIKEARLGCMWIDRTEGREYWLSIPHLDSEGNFCNIRFRSIPPAKKQYRVCGGRPLVLYGADSLTNPTQQVVIVEGELDVLALRSYGFTHNVVSGTSGAAAKWPEEWLDCLEEFQQFLIWYDNDQAGDDGAYKLAKKLGLYRSFRIITNEFNDIGEALEKGISGDRIESILSDNAQPFLKTNLKKVDEFADEIERLILNPHSLIGMPTGSGKLDAVLGGIMSGLWVITGDTGHGKTTWATWLLMRQAMFGVSVMLTSFEQRPIGTVQKLLRAYVGGDFTQVTEDERRNALSKMSKIPLRVFDHYGELKFDHLIDTIRFSARRHDLKIALIDHLGFLVSSSRKTGEDERLVIERIVRKLATVAIQDDLTIVLICHPNNMNIAQQRRVKISDLKGASAIRQDAHVALVVERLDVNEDRGFPATAIHVDKVRSEFGSNGSRCIMAFDPLACVYTDVWEDTPAYKQGKHVLVPPSSKSKSKRRKK